MKKSSGGKNQRVSAQGVSDILSLVGYDIPVRTTKSWDQSTKQEVANWAFKIHLKASDNIHVRIPKKPAIMEGFKEVEFDHWEKKWASKA